MKDFQNFAFPQDISQIGIATIPSATVIAPKTFISKVTGTTQIQTIIPPFDGFHILGIIPVDGVEAGAAGNIVQGYVFPASSRVLLFFYDPYIKKYYIGSGI